MAEGRRETAGRGEAGRGGVVPGTPGPAPGAAVPARTHLHEVVDGLQVGQVVVVHVHADAEVEAGVASVNDLEVPELRGREAVSNGACPGPSRLGNAEPRESVLHPTRGP